MNEESNMEHVKKLLESLMDDLGKMAEGNATVGTPVTVGERHLLPLVELSMALGGGGGQGEGAAGRAKEETGAGAGAAAGGGAKASPVALLVVDHGRVRLEKIGD
jgi:uncharacterized spore protein YtfJ